VEPSHDLEIIADRLSKAGRSLGWVSAVDSEGRTIWFADPHRHDGKRFIVRADEKLTAFLELESAVCACGELSLHAMRFFQYSASLKGCESGEEHSPASLFASSRPATAVSNQQGKRKEEG
jgi:hypothetical protein